MKHVEIDKSAWSGEGTFTALLLERLGDVPGIASVRVEDAPASRSEADYNFISNEVFVAFASVERVERIMRFGFLPGSRTVASKAMTMTGLEAVLAAAADIGAPDYSDD